MAKGVVNRSYFVRCTFLFSRRCSARFPWAWGIWGMVTRVSTVAFQGIEAVPVDVQVQIVPGFPKLIML